MKNRFVHWLVCVVGAGFLVGSVPNVARAARPAAENYLWRNVAIRGGGYVTGLVFHPAAPELLYARTDVGGNYRWDAARRAWVPLNDGIDRANSELTAVLSLALDPSDPRRVYAACGSYLSEWGKPAALLRSADRGASWEAVKLTFKLGGNQDGRGMGERLQVDPHDGETLFLGTNQDGLWRSFDRGSTWSQLPGWSPKGVTFVLFDPRSGTAGKPTPVLYAGATETEPGALRRSDDGGRKWKIVPGQPTGLLIHRAVLDGAGVLYLAMANAPGPNNATAGAVWKYEPAGERWTDITPVRPNAAANDGFGYAGLVADPAHPGTLYASTLDRWSKGDEIFRTRDGGATWEPLLAHSDWITTGAPYVKNMKPHWITDLAVDPAHPERLWIVTGYGVWATEQATADVAAGKRLSWVFPNRGLEETVINELISPPEGAPLLSAMGDLGGFRHDDLAVSPAGGMFQPHHGSSQGIDFAERAPQVMVRTHWGPTRGAISRDGGRTWSEFATAPEAATKHGPGIAAISADAARIVWLPKGGKPFVSRDGGATWTESRTGLVATTEWQTYGPVADRVNPLRFYIYDSVEGALYASEDGGESFARIKSLPAEAGTLRAQPGAEGRLWLPTGGGLMVSDDGGRSFRNRPGVRAAHAVGFGAPAAGQGQPAVFLDGTVDGESAFFRSDDGGQTWVRISDAGMRLGHIRVIAGDARVPGRVYVGTSGRGILVGEPAPAAK